MTYAPPTLIRVADYSEIPSQAIARGWRSPIDIPDTGSTPQSDQKDEAQQAIEFLRDIGFTVLVGSTGEIA